MTNGEWVTFKYGNIVVSKQYRSCRTFNFINTEMLPFFTDSFIVIISLYIFFILINCIKFKFTTLLRSSSAETDRLLNFEILHPETLARVNSRLNYSSLLT